MTLKSEVNLYYLPITLLQCGIDFRSMNRKKNKNCAVYGFSSLLSTVFGVYHLKVEKTNNRPVPLNTFGPRNQLLKLSP